MTVVLKLAWPDLRNARDLGGLPTVDGTATRTEALVRSDTLRRLRPEGWQDLVGYGIRTIIDLRDTALVEREPYGHHELAYHHIPLLPDDFPLPVPMDGGYELALDQGAEAMVKVSRAILGAEAGGVLFHCHSGTGRTGVVTFVLLALCQVHTHAIDTDFRASLALDEANASDIVGALRHRVQATYGGILSYLLGAGLELHELEAIRKRLLR